MTLRWSYSLEFDLEKMIQLGWLGALITLLPSLLVELGIAYIKD